MKKLLHRICVVLILSVIGLMAAPAQAELYMELTQGVNQAIPIAIANLGDPTLDQVINNDLRNSGQFQIVPTPAANYILQGSVSPKGSEGYTVSIELKSAFKVSSGGSAILFQKIYEVQATDFRRLAHIISDQVYEQLTGVKGIFSTKIAYVLKQWPRNSKPVYALEVADADGYNPQTLLVSPSPIMSLTWSPDGKSIAYVSFENNHAAIYLQDLYTGQRQLISSFEGINGAPAFSPDGSQIGAGFNQN